MKNYLYAAFLVLILQSCQNEQKVSNTKPSATEKSFIYAFSDKEKLDTFKVALTGNDLDKETVLFTIKSAQNQEIYRFEIKAQDLLKNFAATAKLKNQEQKQAFINEIISDFFDEQHFLEPAVMPDEKSDNNVPDKKFYEELKQSALNGFEFRTGDEQKQYIAWSKKGNRVSMYYQLK